MNLPEMLPVSSSTIAYIGYNEANLEVYIHFIAGTIYVYKGVPQHEYENLRTAASLGSYLHRNFKNIYPYERVQ